MRFGKRRKDEDADHGVADSPSAPADVPSRIDAATETWTVPAAEPQPPATRPIYAEHEPAVDGEAVELVGDVAPAPGPAAAPYAFTVPEHPAPAVPSSAARPSASAPAPAPAAPAAERPAVAAATAPAERAHQPQEPVMDELRVLASERPEFVVGAAFAGGILAAMIVRRLGN